MRRKILFPLVLTALVAACGSPEGDPTSGSPTPTPSSGPTPTPGPVELTLVRTMEHSGWAEGLDVKDGELWHAYPGSHRVLDLMTGEELRRYTPPTTYSESLMWFQGKLWNVSYHDQNLYAGTLNESGLFDWRVVGTVPEIHSWGITHDGDSVIVTGNGTENLYFLDPSNAALRRTITTPIDDLEDIAWNRGAIWASSYSELPGQFFRVDSSTGGILDIHSLPDPAECEIVDGLAVADGLLYVTGKNCPKIYVFALPD